MLGHVMAIALAASFAPAAAADEPADGGDICVAIGSRWIGDNKDIREIVDIPVPRTYRHEFEGGGCTRFQLLEGSLIDWHLNFGNETSTTRALAYLEADYRRGTPEPVAYPKALEQAWREAEGEFARAALDSARDDKTRDKAERRLRNSRSFRRLEQLVKVHDAYVFLAEQYLRAAEFHGAHPLLDKAQIYLTAVQAGIRILYRDMATSESEETKGLARYLDLQESYVLKVRDWEARLAISRARLSGDSADIAAASRLLHRDDSPAIEQAASNLSEDGGGVCDGDGDEGSGDEKQKIVRDACQDDNYFEWRLISFWRNRAQLDLLIAADPASNGGDGSRATASESDAGRTSSRPVVAGEYWPRPESFRTAVLLLEWARTEPPSGMGYHPSDAEDDLIELHLRRADLFATLRERAKIWKLEYGREALSELATAERLVRPTEKPGRFRQIAERFLALQASIQALAEAGDTYAKDSGNERMAAYLKLVLDNLGHIIVGETSPH